MVRIAHDKEKGEVEIRIELWAVSQVLDSDNWLNSIAHRVIECVEGQKQFDEMKKRSPYDVMNEIDEKDYI